MTDTYSQSAWLIPLFPLVAFLMLMALGKNNRTAGVLIGTVSSLLSLIYSLFLVVERSKPNSLEYSYDMTWLSVGSYSLRIGYEMTNFIAIMLVLVSFISLIIHIYAASYMKNDERVTVFYSYLSLLVFGMLGLIISENLLTLYIFWEVVGISVFLLVGFWYVRPEARQAAKRVFIVTRVGDLSLLLAVLLLFWYMPDHSLSFTMLQSVFSGQAITSNVALAVALLLLLGAISRSGLFPLHIWLTATAEAPLPIKALIHAVVVIVTGLFLIVRTHFIFEAAAGAMQTMAYVGAAVMLIAAIMALGQRDLRKLLTYSIISQLGFIMMGFGLGTLTGAVFQMFTYAFVYALMFLGAGCIIALLGTSDMLVMRGIRRKLPIFCAVYSIGIFVLFIMLLGSNYRSGHMILMQAWLNQPLLYAMGLVAVCLTGVYMTRLLLLVFLVSSSRQPTKSTIGTESRSVSAIMLAMVILLAVMTLIVSASIIIWHNELDQWLDLEYMSIQKPDETQQFPFAVLIGSVLALLIGISVGIIRHISLAVKRVLGTERNTYEVYQYIIVKPYRVLGNVLVWIDNYVLSRILIDLMIVIIVVVFGKGLFS